MAGVDEGFRYPSALLERVEQDASAAEREWLAGLPQRVDELARRWALDLEPPYQPGGQTAWVAPGTHRRTCERVVLKVGWAHTESLHEAAGLLFWSAEGTVAVHEAYRDGPTSALLLEEVRPGTELLRSGVPDEQQDEIVAGLLRRLWRRPADPHPFRPLAQMCDEWASQYEDAPCPTLDPGLGRHGLELFRAMSAPREDDVLLPTDLHPLNVLAGERQPWLLIDPKPYLGDRHYDPLQHMLNFPDRLRSDPASFSDRMAGLCGLDPQRLRLWLFARAVVESSWWPGMDEVARAVAP